MASPKLEKVRALVGRIALSWNEVDLHWYLITTILMKDTPRQQIDAIFHLFHTGAAQRTLSMTVAGTLPETDPLRIRLGKLNTRTCDAAGNRNAAIHALVDEHPEIVLAGTTIKVVGTSVRVAPGAHPTKKNRLSGKQVETELEKIAVEIEQLVNDLNALREEYAPKMTIRADILADMLQRGLQPPSWMIPESAEEPQAGVEQQSPQPHEPRE